MGFGRFPKWLLILAGGAMPLATVTTCDLGSGGRSLLFESYGHDYIDVVVFDDPFAYDCCYVDEIIYEEVIYEEVVYDDWWF